MGYIKKNIKLILFALLIVVVFVLNQKFGWSDYLSNTDNLRFLSEMIKDHFLTAALIYIGLTVIACVVLALPGVTFAILAALLFGPWWGTLFCLIATTLGAIIAFVVGRFFLKDSIKPMVEKNALLKRILFDDADKSDIVLLAITRLVPLFPYNIQNFAYGITDISLAHYSLYTFLFMIPGVALYTIGTAGFTSGGKRWLYFGIAAVLLVFVLFLGWFIRKKYLDDESKDISEDVIMRNEVTKDPDDIIKEYVKDPAYRTALGLPAEITEDYELLAQGEYNVNYLFEHPVTRRKLLLRVNMGSQMHLNRQIEYEAHALKLLEGSGRTPEVLYTDGILRCGDHGILVMEYLPGDHPHYTNVAEMDGVMACMADIHSVQVPASEVIYGEPDGPRGVPRDTVKLIAPADPAIAILDECEAMVRTYMDSPLGDSSVKSRLRAMLDRGHEIAAASPEDLVGGEGYRCIINTELNSTNFLVDGDFVRLVDWEKPLYGDPAQDLGHLLAPTTTFWKTDDILSSEETERLMDVYIKAVDGRFDTIGIKERTRRLVNITCLRGLAWCAMAWIQYKDPDKAIANESTRRKLDEYLGDSFLSDIEKRFGINCK